MPSNVLVMDEPTNDLDIETLEVLENCIFEYPGTILLVSHDRAFLENVVTATFVYQGGGIFREYAGGYREWAAPDPAPAKSVQARPAHATAKKTGQKKLTWQEKEELRLLPGKIEELEARQAKFHEAMTDPAFFKRSGDEIASDRAQAARVDAELAAAFKRWEELESREG
jgi:ATP-binding cassette subfamily F protein uup